MNSFLSSYIQSIASIGICSFICQWIVQNKSQGTKNALNFIAGLCVFISVIFPFIGGMKNFKINIEQSSHENNASQNHADGYNAFLDLTKTDLESKLKSEIFSRTGINVTDIIIDLRIKDDRIYIDKLQITLSEKDISHKEKISEIIYDILNINPQISHIPKDGETNESS